VTLHMGPKTTTPQKNTTTHPNTPPNLWLYAKEKQKAQPKRRGGRGTRQTGETNFDSRNEKNASSAPSEKNQITTICRTQEEAREAALKRRKKNGHPAAKEEGPLDAPSNTNTKHPTQQKKPPPKPTQPANPPPQAKPTTTAGPEPHNEDQLPKPATIKMAD